MQEALLPEILFPLNSCMELDSNYTFSELKRGKYLLEIFQTCLSNIVEYSLQGCIKLNHKWVVYDFQTVTGHPALLCSTIIYSHNFCEFYQCHVIDRLLWW